MQPYEPAALPLDGLDYKRLFPLVGKANERLARYDGLLQGIVNPLVLLSPLTTDEAVLSSRIEGTQATVDEVLEQEAGLVKEGEKFLDIQEITNYRRALYAGHEALRERPITLSLVRQLHKILLSSVRGQDKKPGEFRKTQNWIGSPGCTMDEATFVPPNPLRLPDYLEQWERYITEDDIEPLVQTAIMHAQFELLHPFDDGNGRIGRILIPLYLFQKQKLSQPMFYLSAYLEAHRDIYYARLQNISRQGDWNGWIEFFLNAVAVQAQENSHRVNAIMKLYENIKTRIHEITRSQYVIQLLDALFNRPIFMTTDLIREVGIHKPTMMGLLRQLKEHGILRELRPASGRRAAVLGFPELLNIAEGKDIF